MSGGILESDLYSSSLYYALYIMVESFSEALELNHPDADFRVIKIYFAYYYSCPSVVECDVWTYAAAAMYQNDTNEAHNSHDFASTSQNTHI